MFSLRTMIVCFSLGMGIVSCLPAATPTESHTNTNAPEPAPVMETPAMLSFNEPPPPGAETQFSTDFTIHSVPYNEILSGGPPKDGIPPIDLPGYVSVSEADEWLKDREPVIFVQVDGIARAYPLRILTWHEIVNDTLNEKALIVTFCPLCNTAIAFERELEGLALDFGTTGRLRYSNLIMYDRQTETWWQQATGEAIAGKYTGKQLTYYPAAIISWADYKSRYPAGDVLSQETGYNRDYGRNPYAGYDDINQTPFLFDGVYVDELPVMARVLTVEVNNEAVAYPYETLEDLAVVNDTVGEEEIVVFWVAGTASALDTAQIEAGQDVGAAVAYSRQGATRMLSFISDDGVIRDKETNSVWNIFGEAIKGELEGERLTPIVAVNHFWFSWAAFKPETRIYQP